MKITLSIHAVDWEKRSTYPLEEVEFEDDDPETLLYNLAGFLINGEGEYQMVVKSARVKS